MPKRKRRKSKSDLQLISSMTPEQLALVNKLINAGEQKKSIMPWVPALLSGFFHILDWFKPPL